MLRHVFCKVRDGPSRPVVATWVIQVGSITFVFGEDHSSMHSGVSLSCTDSNAIVTRVRTPLQLGLRQAQCLRDICLLCWKMLDTLESSTASTILVTVA
ncbi:hypothetical protein K431DRAFT_740 [Polychaeton citri CBS 116435]|uniref:Uncharacterized protein n=1 Tax=Polychaeton citri CBS 116435 TaxID=1314669 RepID=A0A9P4QHX6_9PEZI|nr:hypothetical protein K431DRAFT_740 [Polychaeton citri CBS 116435]